MNKKYVVLLSSLIACTSMGMDNGSSSSSATRGRYIPSLLTIAINQLQKNVHQAVKLDAKFLHDAQMLNEENLLKNIKNEIALLELPDYLSEKVTKAYKQSSRWYTFDKVQEWLSHYDFGNTEVMLGRKKAEDCKSEYIVFCNANSDASQVAVIAESLAWSSNCFSHGVPPRSNGRLLYLWREGTLEEPEWSKKLQAKVLDDAEDVAWASSDNQLCIAGKQAIMVFAREKSADDFALLHTVPVVRYSDAAFDIKRMYLGMLTMDALWESFGRFNWNHDMQELAVETERNFHAKKACLAIMQMRDGSFKQTQTIEIPLQGYRGIGVIEWDEEGCLQVSELVGNCVKEIDVHVYDQCQAGTYRKKDRLFVSASAVSGDMQGKLMTEQSQNGLEVSYTLSRAQKDALRAMSMRYANRFNRCQEEWDMTIAMKEHPEYGMRSLGYAHDYHSIFDQYAFKVCNKEHSLYGIAKILCHLVQSEPHSWINENREIYGKDAPW